MPSQQDGARTLGAGRRIGPHHLAFVRAYLQGMDLRVAADRYLDPGLDLRVVRSTLRWLREDFIVAARRRQQFADARVLAIDVREIPGGPMPAPPTVPSLEDFRLSVDPSGDFYGEAELIAFYRERYADLLNLKTPASRRAQRVARLRARQMRALEIVERLLVAAPKAADPPSAWLPEKLAMKLERMQIMTLGATVSMINHYGHRWWTRIPKLGPTGAQRIVAWMERHATQLGVSVHQHATVPRRELMRAIAERPAPARCAVVPLERFAPPVGLSGAAGGNRGVRNRLAADNDLAAIQAWLKARATNPNTFRAYRKEAERLLLWAVVKRGRAFSDLGVEDAMAYREFLADPQPADQWVGKRQAERFTPDWRPFEGPLSFGSVKGALTTVKSLCEWLTKMRYLDSNPFDGVPVPKPSASAPGEDDAIMAEAADRHLPPALWGKVRGYLDGLQHDEEASARLRFVFLLAYSTGLRASELVAATIGRVRRAAWSTDAERYTLTVMGKGGKARSVPFVGPVLAALKTYLATRGLPADLGQCGQKARLIAPLHRYRANHPEAPGTVTTSGLYRVVTGLFKNIAEQLVEEGDSREARRLQEASTHWLRHTFGTHALQKGVSVQNVRGVMGHANVATTSGYLHADEAEAYAGVEQLVS